MNNHLVSYNELLDYWTGNLDAENIARIAKHVETCPTCQSTLAWWSAIRSVVQEDDSVSPPLRAVTRARSIISRYQPARQFQSPRGIWLARTLAFAGGFALAIFLFLGIGLVIVNQDIPQDSILYPVQVTVKGLQFMISNAQKPRAAPMRPTAGSQPLETIPTPTPPAPSPNLVISQIYGGGGNTGATFTHDFIELFNRGTITTSLAGWSLQYASASGTGNFGATVAQITELPNVWLAPGQYYLIQEGRGSGGTTPLPTPDFIDATPIALSATDAKLVLVNTTAPLGCNGGTNPCSTTVWVDVVDGVGYGKSDFFEGMGPAPAGSNTNAIIRQNGGCTDTNNNITDFSAGAPNPRNNASPRTVCQTATPKP